MALRLFEHPLSPYAQKVKIVLYERGIPFERVFVDPNQRSEDPVYQEFVMASPRREVPCLVDGDVRVFDSTIILEYVEERWPRRETAASTPRERARVRMLEEMMDTEYDAVNWGAMEVKVFRRAEAAQRDSLLTRASLQLQRLWNRLERELEGRLWMNGADFGRGDAAVQPHLAGSVALGFGVSERHSKLKDWLARASARSSVQRVAAESAEWLRRERAAAGASERPRIVRQYRDHRLEWMLKTGGADIVVEGLLQGTVRFADEFE
jgi:glutathione S-transferase/RNA polymerase-associated protein